MWDQGEQCQVCNSTYGANRMKQYDGYNEDMYHEEAPLADYK